MVKKILLLPLITAIFITPATTHCSLGLGRVATTAAIGACAGLAGEKAVTFYNTKASKQETPQEEIEQRYNSSKLQTPLTSGIVTALGTDLASTVNALSGIQDLHYTKNYGENGWLSIDFRHWFKRNLNLVGAPALIKAIARNSFLAAAGITSYSAIQKQQAAKEEANNENNTWE